MKDVTPFIVFNTMKPTLKPTLKPTIHYLVFGTMAWIGATAHHAVDAAEPIFDSQVLPLLREHCVDCHGPDTAESGLRLDTMLDALRGGDSGERVIVPGAADRSYLMDRVTSDNASQRMPPDSMPLPEQHVKLLQRWIDQREIWAASEQQLAESPLKHWAFLPPQRPQTLGAAQGPAAIDALVAARLADADLAMGPRASKERLIRRLYLVMHGLPPAWEEVERFLADTSDDAWPRLVEQVLTSPRYGERWATHWLDLVRFGETHGFETNRERPHAWRFRDWVIQSLNADKPYDQFVREQIAGDANGAPLGTGFLVAGPYDLVKGADPNLRLMQRQDELADMINTTGTAFLGLTMGCARCHNHKFDPISQTDYYAMQAVFAGVNHADRDLPPSSEKQQAMERLGLRIAALRRELAPYLPRVLQAQRIWDDTPERTGLAWRHLKPPAGEGKYPAGAKRGFANDPGSENRAPNISGGRYTWWKNQPGEDLAVCELSTAGRYRVWLSWGAGWSNHSQDAEFWLDADGDLATTTDQTLLARVNQQQFAGANDEQTVAEQSLWSGFLDAGVHQLQPAHAIVLRGGASGEAVTLDALLLEPVDEDAQQLAFKPNIRPAVNPKHNEEQFPPREAKHVRFTIERTNQSQPCIDELEVFAAGRNVALQSAGTVATSSGDFVHPKHKLEQINDGRYGNSRSWIAAKPTGWVELEFAKPQRIDRIVWARDREGIYTDRLTVAYRIESSLDGQSWRVLASSADRLPFSNDAAKSNPLTQYDFSQAASPEEARQARERAQLARDLQTRYDALGTPAKAYVGSFAQPGATHRLYRGEPTSPREQVAPAGIQSLAKWSLPADAPEQQRRVALANWIASAENPLTARVIVNRIWQHHFGVGIVDTPSDFGANGTAPSHPLLLDWLACELMEHGWSLKHIHRTILLSRVWQQDSAPRPKAMRVDAGARLLWRFPPRRLAAEGIRDSMLMASGDLRLEMGGPGFSAFEVQQENVRHYFPKQKFGPEDWRRMIYMTKVRQERDAVFGVFDCPDYSQVTPKRSRSTTPLQALNLLNSRFVLQQADRFAARLQRDSDTAAEQVRTAYRRVYGREASTYEVAGATRFIESTSLEAFARALLNSNEFVFIP